MEPYYKQLLDTIALNSQGATVYQVVIPMDLSEGGYTWIKAQQAITPHNILLPTHFQLKALRDLKLNNMPYAGRQWVPVNEVISFPGSPLTPLADWYHPADDVLWSELSYPPPTIHTPYNGATYDNGDTAWDNGRYPDGFKKFFDIVDMGNNTTLMLGFYGIVYHEPGVSAWASISPSLQPFTYDPALNPILPFNESTWLHPVGCIGDPSSPLPGLPHGFLPSGSYVTSIPTSEPFGEDIDYPPVSTIYPMDYTNPPATIDLGVAPSGLHYRLIYAVTWSSTLWFKVDFNGDGLFKYPGDYQVSMNTLASDLQLGTPALITRLNRDGILNGYEVRLPTVEEMWTLYATSYSSTFASADYTWGVGNDPANPSWHCALLPWSSFNGQLYYRDPEWVQQLVIGMKVN